MLSLLNIIKSLFLLVFLGSCSSQSGDPVLNASMGAGVKTGLAEKVLTVDLQPFGDFDTAQVSFAARELEDFYQMKTRILPALELPSSAWYASRNRYRADSLLIWLKANKAPATDHILGLTNRDISCTKDPYPDWGIFGFGYMPGKACVVSTFRLMRNNASETLLRERFAKVLLHEIGHNLGLDHCPAPQCMMGDAKGTLETVDQETKQLCQACKNKLGITSNP